LTAHRRRLPDFLLIGAQRAGTSSLYKYLGHHPLVIPSLRKETGYFSRHYSNEISWYRAHFPLERSSKRALCFEATPDYLYWPTAPARVASTLPEARFLVLLRDPIERAFSHYKHMVRLGFEPWSFAKAIGQEEERIANDRAALDSNEFHYTRPFRWFSYSWKGLYADQLSRWFDVFPRDRFFVVFSEDFYGDPQRTYERILEFLGVPFVSLSTFPNYSYQRGQRQSADRMDSHTRAALAARFAEANERLCELLGYRVPWVQ
jgi:hypothetical protein